VNGLAVTAFVDSGAMGNYASPRWVNRFKIPWVRKREPYQLQTVEGTLVEYDNGTVNRQTENLSVEISGRIGRISFDITEVSGHDIILGLPWLRSSNPVIDWSTGQLYWTKTKRPAQGTLATAKRGPVTLQPSTTEARERATTRIVAFIRQKPQEESSDGRRLPPEYERYKRLFQNELEMGLPEHSRWDHEIPLKPGTQPKFHPIYGLDEEKLTVLREYIDENLKKGYIRQSTSPAGYPLLFVPKKTKPGQKKKWRLCVDYRQLNDITIKNRYPLPLISEMRDRLQGAQWFTALDLKGAYNLIRIKEGEEWKTAFRSRYGHYEYLVMPFGLTNAPASFQTMINDVLREHLDMFVIAYLDDILIYSKTLEEHKKHVETILKKLMDANLLVELEKSYFHVQKVDFLGCTIEPGKLRMQEDKIKAIKEWPTPTNDTEVRSFLGYVNFYRRFLKDYGDRIRPLTDLTRKDRGFEWKESQEQAFQQVKDAVTKEPVLTEPDPARPYEVETDASNFATGGQLGQRDDDGKLHPVAFFSKKLKGAELNYPVHDKELMAVVEAFKEWKVYLIGARHQITVYSDHHNLIHFTTTKELNGRQARWSQFLSEFDFVITYRKGTANVKADLLSRRADHKGDEGEEKTLFQKTKKGLRLATAYRLKPASTPKSLRDFVRELHESPIGGHQGIMKTVTRVRMHRNEPRVLQTVREVIRTCEQCNKNKSTRHKPYGLLKPIPPPTRAWGSVSWDLIVKLPPSKEPVTGIKYDSILVIVERLTKYAYFIPYKESHTAEELAYAFERTIVCNHGLPDEVITDRGTTFASKFWSALMKQVGTKHKLSSAYHPQTNGQTERTNQTLEQYLRNYVNFRQDDWVRWLPIAQLAYNTATSESTGTSPFFANYGFETDNIRSAMDTSNNPAATVTAAEMKKLHEELRQELSFVNERMTTYANRARTKGPSFQEGDKVYLSRRNIKTKRPNDKLDHKRIGPFKIARKLSEVSYELDLPKDSKLHPRFHVSLLEPAPKGTKLQQTMDVEDPEDYEVEAILDHRGAGTKTEYFVKWKGYDNTENTWEPRKHLNHCDEVLAEYQKRHAIDFIDWTRMTQQQKREYNRKTNYPVRQQEGPTPRQKQQSPDPQPATPPERYSNRLRPRPLGPGHR
jgi:hypothetical protein